jgi:hypothetical protein
MHTDKGEIIMARGRMLPADIANSAELSLLEPEALAAWLLTIPHFDRDGLIIGNPLQLRGLVCPMIISLHDRFAGYIDQWVEANLVVRYAIGGGLRVLFNPNFRIDNAYMEYTKERPSRFPPPPNWSRHKLGLVPDDEGMLERLIYSLDVKNGYRKMLEGILERKTKELTESLSEPNRSYIDTASRSHREAVATTSRPHREGVATRSQLLRSEDQDQDQIQSDADADLDPDPLTPGSGIGGVQGGILADAPDDQSPATDPPAYNQLAAWYSQNSRAQRQIEQLRNGGTAYLDTFSEDELKVVALGYGGFANVLDHWIGGFYEFLDECAAPTMIILIEWLYYYACVKKEEERAQIRDLAAVIKSNMGLSKKSTNAQKAPLTQQQRRQLLDEARLFLEAMAMKNELC